MTYTKVGLKCGGWKEREDWLAQKNFKIYKIRTGIIVVKLKLPTDNSQGKLPWLAHSCHIERGRQSCIEAHKNVSSIWQHCRSKRQKKWRMGVSLKLRPANLNDNIVRCRVQTILNKRTLRKLIKCKVKNLEIEYFSLLFLPLAKCCTAANWSKHNNNHNVIVKRWSRGSKQINHTRRKSEWERCICSTNNWINPIDFVLYSIGSSWECW